MNKMSEDELKKYHHFKMKTGDGIELDLIETKYYEELLDLYQQEKEKNKFLKQRNEAISNNMLSLASNSISKDKIREVLEKYKYTEIEDSMKIIAFYKAIQKLLEEN